MSRKYFGSDGEYTAHDYLTGQGYKVLEMNYRRPTGEIDVIARQRDTLVFVEVKRRTTRRYGTPAEAVTPQKRMRILKTAALYLQEKGLQDVSARFDIIEITPGEVKHIPAAFDATGIGWI